MIVELTSQQQSLILDYSKKWRAIAFSTDKLDYQQVEKTIKSAYQLMELQTPHLLFFESPLQMLKQLGDPPSSTSSCNLFSVASNIHEPLRKQMAPLLWTQLWRRQSYGLGTALFHLISHPLIAALREKLGYSISPQTERQITALPKVVGDVAMLDFFISELKCTHDFHQQWQTLTALVKNCPWHLAFEDVCIVCQRPIKIVFKGDNQSKVGEKPAIQFADRWYVRLDEFR